MRACMRACVCAHVCVHVFVCMYVFVHIVLYLSISIALLPIRAFQKRSRPQQLILCRRLHAEVTGNCKKKLQATVTEGLAQGPYVAASMGFEPTTLRSKGIDSTNAPPRPTI